MVGGLGVERFTGGGLPSPLKSYVEGGLGGAVRLGTGRLLIEGRLKRIIDADNLPRWFGSLQIGWRIRI